MTFVSYAQNFEDVLLSRALKGVSKGFYIDVGASHPTLDSVTYAFYERGWHGINIEPVAADFKQLQEQRPNDINLQLAVSDHVGTVTLYQFAGARGLATLSKSVTERHQSAGYVAESVDVQVAPLAEVCARYVTGEIHFLKIDVEGSEAEVIRGMDFKRWRPWILVVEATLPLSLDQNHALWEPMLLEQGYQHVYFDGLNRYYVADEKERQLRASLSTPPNVFDGFVTASVVKAREELTRLQEELEARRLKQTQFPGGEGLYQQVTELERELLETKTQLIAAREAFTHAEQSEHAAQRAIRHLTDRVQALEADPYFKTGEAIRALRQRWGRR